MPPTINPGETRETATIRWLTTLLAALVHQSKDGLVRVSRFSLAKDHDGLDLLESRDKNGDVLLHFDAVKHLAIYPLQSGGVQWQKTQPAAAQTQPPSSPTPSPEREPFLSEIFSGQTPGPAPGVTPPKSHEQLRSMEEKLRKEQLRSQIFAAKLNQEQNRRQSLEALLEAQEVRKDSQS